MDAQQLEWMRTHTVKVGDYIPSQMSWYMRGCKKPPSEEELIRNWCEGDSSPFVDWYKGGMDDGKVPPSQRKRRGRPRKF